MVANQSINHELPIRSTAPKLVSIKTDLLVPGRGGAIKNGAAIPHKDKFYWVGSQSSIPAKYKALEFTHVPVLMPGLWAARVHFFGTSDKKGPPA